MYQVIIQSKTTGVVEHETYQRRRHQPAYDSSRIREYVEHTHTQHAHAQHEHIQYDVLRRYQCTAVCTDIVSILVVRSTIILAYRLDCVCIAAIGTPTLTSFAYHTYYYTIIYTLLHTHTIGLDYSRRLIL